MGKFLLRLLIYAIAVLIAASVLPGVHVMDFWSAIVVAGILTLLNALLKPVLVILTLPLTVVTLGLFLLVINTVIILLADNLFSGFEVDGFWWALIFSLVLSVINSVFLSLTGENQK